MSKLKFNNFLLWRKRLFLLLATLAFSILATPSFYAHQLPDTIVLLDVGAEKVTMELQIPLSELELTFGQDVTKNTETLVERLEPQLKDYLLAHSTFRA